MVGLDRDGRRAARSRDIPAHRLLSGVLRSRRAAPRAARSAGRRSSGPRAVALVRRVVRGVSVAPAQEDQGSSGSSQHARCRCLGR